jgi:type II secretory pathway pseudopilin PulG
MGYEDYTVKFQAEAKNIVGLKVEEETKVDTSALEALVNQAKALTESDYTAASWNNLAIELSESVEMLKSTTLTQAQVNEQVTHLTEAINGLVKAEQSGDKDDPADNKGDQNGNQNGNTNAGNTNAGNTNSGNNQSGATNTGSQSGNTSTDKTNTSTNKTSTNKTSTDKTTSSTGSTGESTVVKTADESHILLWLGALVVSCLAFVGTVVFARKKQD